MGAGDGGFVSRGGIKLAHALDVFDVDVTGLLCADFGCSTGGFTDCLLQRGAARVYAVDTGYGVLDYRLRMDERVVVMERTNALHAEFPSPSGREVRGEGSSPPSSSRTPGNENKSPHPGPLPEGEGAGGVDLVTIDLGWTRQKHAIPAALRWVKPDGSIITLIKPHYELEGDEKQALLHDGQLPPDDAERIFLRVIEGLPSMGVLVVDTTKSPITGGKSSRKSGGGNVEYLALLRPHT